MSPAPMPAWLTRQLIHDGLLTPDRVTKHARPRLCKTCGLYTLTGLDDLLPSTVRVDPRPTTTAGEAFALLTGRASYGLDAGELFERYASRIAHRPADTTPVYVTHCCGAPQLPVNPLFLPNPILDQEGEPPF